VTRWVGKDSRTSVLNQADPLRCPKCGGTMKNIAFVEADQGDIIRKILEHCGLWEDPPAARLVDARRPGRRQVRNRPRLPGICPPRRGLRRRFRGVFPQVSRPNCPGRRESGSEIAHFVLEPGRDPIILCAGQPRRGSPEPGKSAKEAKRMLQAPNKAGPEDHAGVKRPWCPNPITPMTIWRRRRGIKFSVSQGHGQPAAVQAQALVSARSKDGFYEFLHGSILKVTPFQEGIVSLYGLGPQLN
jgi:hypothetical protein